MSTFLIRYATYQSSSYSIALLMRLVGPRSYSNNNNNNNNSNNNSNNNNNNNSNNNSNNNNTLFAMP